MVSGRGEIFYFSLHNLEPSIRVKKRYDESYIQYIFAIIPMNEEKIICREDL